MSLKKSERMIFKTDDMKIKLRNIIFLLAIFSGVVLNQSCGTPSNIPQTETVTQIYGSSFGNAPQVFSRYLPSDGIAEGTKIVFQTSNPERGLKVMNYHFESLFGAPQDISVIELDASRYEFKVADHVKLVRTSEIASAAGAAAAINGTFYDMKKGNSTSAEAASVFKKWVNQVNHTIPVIVLCHMPIQASRGDNNGASYWNEALNYAATGVEGITTTDVSADITRNVLFLHGHNHTNDPVEHYFGAGTMLSVQVDKSSEQSNNPANPSGGHERPPHGKAEGILSNIYYTYLTAGYLKTSGNATLVSIVDGALNLTKFNGGQTVSLGSDGVTSDPMGESLTIAAQRHHEGEAIEQNITGATCEHGGAYDVVICCSVCGEELHRTHIETEALGHSWGEWTVARKAAQTAEGEEVRICSECGKKETRPIPKLEAEKTSESASSDETKDAEASEQTKEAESPRTAASPRTADQDQWSMWLIIMCLAAQAAVVVRARRN